MKQYADIPSKALRVNVSTISGTEFWPYDNGHDPYWRGGSSPKYYRWVISMNVTVQYHSSPNTRLPNTYTGVDVHVGDYIADTDTGTALKIINITSKTDEVVVCEVEDVSRYNTYRDPSGTGTGIFALGSDALVFELNEDYQPVVETNTEVSKNFYNNLSSRFQNVEGSLNFVINKDNHGFKYEDLIAADTANNTFVLASPDYPYLVGTVTDLDIGPNAFAVNPFTKVLDNFNSLIGNTADVIYADPNNAGKYALSGNQPIMIKLREETATYSKGAVASPSTFGGYEFNLNSERIMVSSGSMLDFISDVNAHESNTGVICGTYEKETISEPDTPPAGIMVIPGAAKINNVLVNFTTDTSGSAAAGAPGFANMYDIAFDINAANIPNLRAEIFVSSMYGDVIRLVDAASNDILIENVTNDGWGNPFAGSGSTTGLPLSVVATGDVYVVLTAVDARPIDLLDVSGTPTLDFGLTSSENGTKAAALFIEQGIRQASTYVVSSIPARDALSAVFGDQCFVQDTGNGEWAYYIYTLANEWIKLSDKDSSETDAQSVEIEIEFDGPASGTIHTVSNGRRVTFVTVSVVEAFDHVATISVGDDAQNNRLMTVDQNDLSAVSEYSTTPSYTYSNGTDTDIKYYFTANGATVGKAVIAITYT